MLKTFILCIYAFIVAVLATGCGKDNVGVYSQPTCHVSQTGSGASISCPDGSGAAISNGAQGAQGPADEPCSVAASPTGATIFCPDGTTSPISNGTNGSIVSSVQFCPSEGPTIYPTHFPEYGLVVDGVIYAVYYDGTNAWLSQIPPGTYESTATGLQCDFTVNSNGSITQN